MNKRLFSILLSVLLITALLLSGCGQGGQQPADSEPGTSQPSGGTETSTPSSEPSDSAGSSSNLPLGERPEGGWKFGYTCMDGTNPFFVILEKTIREGVEANGDTLISMDPANDVSLQITQIEDMITQGIHAIFLNPAEAEGILPALDMLKEAGIPILNFDTEVAELEYCFSYVGSDNYNAGYVCGEDLVKKRPNGGPIIILDSPTMNSINDREKGFKDAIEGKGFEIVAEQDAKGNLEVAMGIAEDLLQAHSDVVAIFGGNDPTALGALAAANAAGLKDVLIYGVDGSPDIKKELASGDSLIEGSGAQSPINIAKISVEVMYKYLNGEKVDDRYPVETFLMTSENVHEYGIDGWQ